MTDHIQLMGSLIVSLGRCASNYRQQRLVDNGLEVTHNLLRVSRGMIETLTNASVICGRRDMVSQMIIYLQVLCGII
jgi:hypothetical protein